MKKLFFLSLSVFFIFLASYPFREELENVNEIGRDEKIIARRGYWGEYPESTLLGYEKAKEIGAWLSADTQLSKDMKWMLLHDDNLKRLYCVDRNASDVTSEEMKLLTYCGPHKKNFGVQGIPQLAEYLDSFGADTIEIEIKTIFVADENIKKQKFLELIELTAPYHDNIYFTSFYYGYIELLKKLDPKLKTGIVIFSQDDLKNVLSKDISIIDVFSVRQDIVDESMGFALQNAKKDFWFYDMGDSFGKSRLRQLIKYKPSGFVMSYPLKDSRNLLGL